MEYTEIEPDVYIIRLSKGQSLMEQLTSFVEKESIASGWVSAIGGASWVELGFYNLGEQTYSWERFDMPVEITNLDGNITHEEEGNLFIHLHGTFSDASFHAIGGHVTDLEVAGTVEIMVKAFDEPLPRQYDEAVGLKLFSFKKK